MSFTTLLNDCSEYHICGCEKAEIDLHCMYCTEIPARHSDRAVDVFLASSWPDDDKERVADAVGRVAKSSSGVIAQNGRVSTRSLDVPGTRPLHERFVHLLDTLLSPALGHHLRRVVYWTIKDECTAGDVVAGVGWFGGEVELEFENLPRVFITWGENEGWNDHFSLLVRPNSAFKAGTLVGHSAETAPEWAPHLGQPLIGAECRGTVGTPHLLVVYFGTGAVVLGDGYEGTFGDGDDVIVMAFGNADIAAFSDSLWVVGPPAA